MEPVVPALLFGCHSAFLFDVAKDVLDQKLKTTIRHEEQMEIQEKIFSSPGRPIGVLNLPLEERLRRDREALRKLLSEG